MIRPCPHPASTRLSRPAEKRPFLIVPKNNQERPLSPLSLRSVAVVILGNLAYWHRRKLRWDPKGWDFVGDREASRWLDRERRDPWRLPEVG